VGDGTEAQARDADGRRMTGLAWRPSASAPTSARSIGAIRLGLIVAGILAAIVVWQIVVLGVPNGGDGWSYWQAPYSAPYERAVHGELLSYLYSPAFLQALFPLKVLPFPLFNAVWVALLCSVAVLLAGPLAFVAILLPPVLVELEVGNIHLLLGLVAALGLRYPALWSFALLTKITPGVGIVWFLVRREWRSLGVAVGITLAIGAASFVLAPALWFDWTHVFGRSTTYDGSLPVPLVLRLPIAAAVVGYAGRTDRPWLVPIASMLALPDLWFNGLAMLLGVIPLLRWERTPRWLYETLGPLHRRRGWLDDLA
jgi:hypothetical protein